MRKRIIWIVLAALLLVVLVALLWWWFLGADPGPAPSGSLGTSGERPGQQQGSGSTPTNIGTPITPGGTFIGGTTQGGGVGSSGGSAGGSGGQAPPSSPPGVSWLGGGNIFSPTPINEVSSAVAGGLPNFAGSDPSSGGSNGLGTGLAGLGLATVSCAIFLAPGPGSVPSIPPAVYTKDSSNDNKSFLDCMMRTVAKVALQQMTTSIVAWINSGFEGKPSFVQNYEQFFANVGDQAAGEFIRGSALSFLCSPFQPQVRIAIARSYARRNQAPSCTLTQVTSNINRFLQGDFSAGGWRGLFAFTTMPTNNPYGAFMYAEAGLYNAQGQALQVANQKLSYGRGFLSMEECTGPLDLRTQKKGPPCKVVTPGTYIEGQLEGAAQTAYRQLELADNFDEILSALITQLITRSLQGGLANLNLNSASASGGTPQQLQEAQTLLTDLQAAVSLAQQYGYTKQGSIGDIQNAQQQLQTLANCYAGRGDDDGEDDALQEIAELEGGVGSLNSDIARANSAIATLQQLQTRLTTASSPSQMQTIKNDFSAAIAAGALITQSTVTQAQQDRTALQSEMSALNQQTAAKLNQCYAGT